MEYLNTQRSETDSLFGGQQRRCQKDAKATLSCETQLKELGCFAKEEQAHGSTVIVATNT